jgi:hypothetical protein
MSFAGRTFTFIKRTVQLLRCFMSGSQAGVVIYGLDRDSHSTNRTMTALMAGDVSDRP